MPDWALGLALVLLALLAYLPSLRAEFLWDDDEYLLSNRLLWEAGGLSRIWLSPAESQDYYPLVFTTYWVERRVWGFHPAGYHAVNAVLYALGAAALWGVLRRLKVPYAWTAAAAFALHPVHAESVGWITERKDVLMGLFGFLAVRAWLDYDRRPDRGTALSCFACFLLALLSKTVACVLAPAMLLLSWRSFRRDPNGIARRLALLTILFAVGGAMGLLTARWQAEKLGAKGEAFDFTLIERTLIAARACWFYIGKIIWPNGSAMIYPRWNVGGAAPTAWIFPAGAAAVLGWLFVARWNDTRLSAARMAAALYLVMLSPAMGFINFTTMKYSFVADHYQFLAGAAVIVPLATAWAGLFARKRAGAGSAHNVSPKLYRRGISAFALLLGSALTFAAQGPLSTLEASWRNTLRRNRDSATAWHGLGGALHEKGQRDEALEAYARLLELEPDHVEGLVNAGALLSEMGHVAEAEARFKRALELTSDYAPAHTAYGLALSRTGRASEAISHFEAALKLSPDAPDALMNLGAELAGVGRFDEAEPALRRAAELRPLAPESWVNLGVMLAQRERWSEAAEAFARATDVKPGDAAIEEYLKEARRRAEGK